MAFGVTSTGFVPKRYPDIVSDIQASLDSAFGKVDVDPESVIGQLISIQGNMVADVWAQAENIFNSAFPATAENTSLDNACSYTGILRLPAIPTKVVAHMSGTEGTTVPAATQFSMGGSIVVETDVDADITHNSLSKILLTVDSVINSHNYVTVLTTGGESVTSTVASGTGKTTGEMAEAIVTALQADGSFTALYTATWNGDNTFYITAKTISTAYAFSCSVDATLTATTLWSPVDCTCTVDGPNPIPAGSLTTIVTPVSGLTAVTNLLIGFTGADIESDTALRQRRNLSTNVVGGATLTSILTHVLQDIPAVSKAFVFENTTGSTDSAGRPANSIEVVVYAPNNTATNELIANKIWERKPAGILTYGTTSVNVVDSNTDTQVVKFSHTTTKYVWVELTCTHTGSDQSFPLNGAETIKSAVYAFGNGLSFGSDLLIQQFAALGYVVGGVVTVVARLAVTDAPTDSPSYGTVNISVSDTALPVFDLSRITVVVN